jgi:hypothetical protein
MDILALLESLRELFQDFHASLWLGLAAVLYIAINILRGKLGFNIPFVTKLWNKIESKALKTGILLGLFGLAGGITALASAGVTIWLFLDGVIAGLALGVTTIGARHTAKTALQSNSVQKMKAKTKELLAKTRVFSKKKDK